MINPINGDKPIGVSTERSGESAKSQRDERTVATPSTGPATQSAKPASNVDVDEARRLYDLENQAPRVSAEITTAEQARSLLDQILQQFKASPEQAFKTQSGNAPAVASKLLQASPA